MKVLVFNLTPRWGMLHYSSQFCNELSKIANIKVTIADYYNENLYNENIGFLKIRTNPNPKSFIFDTLSFWNHIIFLFKIIRFKPDIIHFLDNHPWYIAYSKLFKMLGYKIYVTQHDPTLHTWEWASLQWKIAEKTNQVLRDLADKLFVHWEKLRNELIEKYNISENKVISIVHGNYNFFKDVFSKWWKVEKNTFLFFGRIVDYKWLDLLLNSLFIVKEKIPDFKLIIAWPGDLSKYREYIEKLKDNLEIFNYNIEPEEAYKFFEKSGFLILPYHDATWSWVIPVAYAFSKPVIITNVWALPSVVENNLTWLIVEKNNIAKLAENIILMLENKEKTIEMWKKWREFSDRELWWEWVVKKVYNLI